jgi:hypothetical protein
MEKGKGLSQEALAEKNTTRQVISKWKMAKVILKLKNFL